MIIGSRQQFFQSHKIHLYQIKTKLGGVLGDKKTTIHTYKVNLENNENIFIFFRNLIDSHGRQVTIKTKLKKYF